MDAGEVPFFAFYHVYQVDGKMTIGGVDDAHHKGDFVYTNFESTSYWQVKLDGLKLSDAAVETEFIITVPFFCYCSAVLEGTSGILSHILSAWASGSSAYRKRPPAQGGSFSSTW